MQLDDQSRKIAALVAFNEKQLKELNRLIVAMNEVAGHLRNITDTLDKEKKEVITASENLRQNISHVQHTINNGFEQASEALKNNVSDTVTSTLTSLARDKLAITFEDTKKEWYQFDQDVSKEIKKSLKEAVDEAGEATRTIVKEMKRFSLRRMLEASGIFAILVLLVFLVPVFYKQYIQSEIVSLQNEKEQREIMLNEWKTKAPLADIRTCGQNQKPCVQVENGDDIFISKDDKKYIILK
ncbi:hypothetical protein AWF99_25625 [Escherichia coli]|uniref:hypothetical protein n=1 Tax=Escherichia coli TaxID=562 RepID=UPI0007516094|nr:hypothetical protein [Escherichia coli]EAO6934621.1 hypothetical protein [Salmonella enterica]KUY12407.1 hypothetical protein AWF99_25625 [Escherichia coli]